MVLSSAGLALADASWLPGTGPVAGNSSVLVPSLRYLSVPTIVAPPSTSGAAGRLVLTLTSALPRVCTCALMSPIVLSRKLAWLSSPDWASPCWCSRIDVSVSFAVLFATVSSSNTARTANATSGSSATPTIPTSRRLRKRRLGSRLRGRPQRPNLMACLQIPSRLQIAPSALRPLRFHYTGGAQWTLVHMAGLRLLPPARPRRRLAMRLVMLAAILASGCTSSPTKAPPPGGTGGPIVQGGTVTVGVWQAPTTLLDAGVVGNLPFADVIAAPVEEGLLWYQPVSATAHTTTEADYWSPDLATAVPTLSDGGLQTSGCADISAAMCVTWHLRPGVRWDDGSDLTSHDVCDTFAFHWLAFGPLGKPSPTPLNATAGWNQVSKCTELDRNTAVIDFKSRYGPYLALGSGVDGILPASVLDPILASEER